MKILMDLLNVFCLSIGSLIVLFILAKLMGDKQIAQLSLFDYIVGITIGSIAAEMATSLEGDFLKPLVAMVVYAVATFVISFFARKTVKFRKLLNGKPTILYDEGKLFYDNFKKAKMDLNEFLTQCRNMGYFDLSQVQTIVFEPSGRLSILPTSQSRPLTPQDMQIYPKQEKLLTTIIIDGRILEDNLHHIGKDESWLKSRLLDSGVSSVTEVFFATCNTDGNVTLYTKS